jgi:hypothetical protein
MKTTQLALGTAALLALPAALSADTSPAPDGTGSAIATVLHSETREPLADMPVYVVHIDNPDGGTTPSVQIFNTGKDGRAFLSPLETGNYAAWVDWNNNRSEPVEFYINGNTDFVPMITILFNPDIDDAGAN